MIEHRWLLCFCLLETPNSRNMSRTCSETEPGLQKSMAAARGFPGEATGLIRPGDGEGGTLGPAHQTLETSGFSSNFLLSFPPGTVQRAKDMCDQTFNQGIIGFSRMDKPRHRRPTLPSPPKKKKKRKKTRQGTAKSTHYTRLCVGLNPTFFWG